MPVSVAKKNEKKLVSYSSDGESEGWPRNDQSVRVCIMWPRPNIDFSFFTRWAHAPNRVRSENKTPDEFCRADLALPILFMDFVRLSSFGSNGSNTF